MKYLLLIYGEEKTWSGPELEKCYQESMHLVEDLKAEGKYLASAPLQPAKTASSVRVRDGKPIVTDGPFTETREQLGGYFLIDARDQAEAIQIAERLPAARKGTVEVRAVVDLPSFSTE